MMYLGAKQSGSASSFVEGKKQGGMFVYPLADCDKKQLDVQYALSYKKLKKGMGRNEGRTEKTGGRFF